MPEVRKAQVPDLDESQCYMQEDDCFETYHREGDELSSGHWEQYSTTVHVVPTGEGMGVKGWRRGRTVDRQWQSSCHGSQAVSQRKEEDSCRDGQKQQWASQAGDIWQAQEAGVGGCWWVKNWHMPGTSLMVQWLRLHVPNAGAWVRSLVRELDPTCRN